MNDSTELELAGYQKVYDYTQYSHTNHVNIIPEDDFKRLVRDTFKIIADNLRRTYGPYGSQLILNEQSTTMTSKDGFNAFQAIGFGHTYKRIVYLAISDIIKRVNRNVGDGTTSCILLAEKIFNEINAIIKTPDDKRLLLKCLTEIEKNFQDSSIIKKDTESGIIRKLDKDTLKTVISMAANYDEELTNVIYDALDPSFDDFGNVTSVRNVVPDASVSLSSDSNATYEIDLLPGEYRAPIHMIDVNDAITLANMSKMKVVIYDHAFNQADWANLRKNWDGTDLLIIARTYTNGFLSEDLVSFAKEKKIGFQLGQCPDNKTHLYLSQIKGDNVQNELKDLAEIIDTTVRDMYAGEVDFNEVPTIDFQIYKYDCLCLYGISGRDHSEYITKLIAENEEDKTKSYVKQKELAHRIQSINLSKDALLTVKCGTQLEAKLITDKIVDCVSIVESAINSGIVPNILNYAYWRIHHIYEDGEKFTNDICAAIASSIKGLFLDIYKSKYGDQYDINEASARMDKFYSVRTVSYDIIDDKFVNMAERPTSAQYDLEVVVAALSIVKYLLSGGALIFDAQLQKNVNDDGHYIR